MVKVVWFEISHYGFECTIEVYLFRSVVLLRFNFSWTVWKPESLVERREVIVQNHQKGVILRKTFSLLFQPFLETSEIFKKKLENIGKCGKKGKLFGYIVPLN